MEKPVNSFNNFYDYFSKKNFSTNELLEDLKIIIEFYKQFPDDEEFIKFNDQIDNHIKSLINNVSDVIRTYSFREDAYSSAFDIIPNDNNLEIGKLTRFLQMPYRNHYDPNVDYYLFATFRSKEFSRDDNNDYLTLFKFLSNKVTINDLVQWDMVGYYMEYKDCGIELTDLLSCLNYCKKEAFRFVREQAHSIKEFKKNPKIFGINKYLSNDDIIRSFIDYYNNKWEYYNNPRLKEKIPHIIGNYGELLFYKKLGQKYGYDNVIWVSKEVGDGFGYDFLITGEKLLALEVKTTANSNYFDNFIITNNEYNKYNSINNLGDENRYIDENDEISRYEFVNILVDDHRILKELHYGVKCLSDNRYYDCKYNEFGIVEPINRVELKRKIRYSY